MEDYLEEELQIMEEQSESATVLSAETFTEPIEKFLEIMELPSPISVPSSSSVAEAVKMMQDKSIGSVLVVDNDQLKGIFTERDVLTRVYGKIDNPQDVKITEVMTEDPITLYPKDMIAYVMNNMHVGAYRHVPIIDEKTNKPLHVISIKDVVKFVLDNFPEEVMNITGEPYRGPVSREGA